MRLIVVIRLVLALVLLWDVPVLVYAAVLLFRGGTEAVHSWVVHVALMGRLFDAGVAEQQRLIVQAYVLFAAMLVTPPALFWLQRWLVLRVAAKPAR